MVNFKFFTILFTVLCLACNISILQAKLIERSSKKMPNWIGKNSEDKKKLYFAGSSTQENFDKARKMAVNDALAQVAESLDLTMSVNTDRIISDTGVFLEDRTRTRTREVRLLDAKIKDVYFEQYDNSGKISYTVHALVEYNKKDYEQEKARLAKEYEQLKQNLANRYTKANVLINDNSYFDALPELMEVLELIYNYGINQTLEPEVLSKINDILSKITFKNSFSSSENHSGIKTKVSACFLNSNDVCKNYVFTVKTLNDFSIETVHANETGEIDYTFNKVSYLKKSNYKLDLDLQTTFNLEDDFVKKYSFKQVTNELDFLGDNKKIILNVSANKMQENLIKVLSSYLVQNGFVIVKNDADYVLNLKFNFIETSQTEIKTLQSPDGTLFISNASVVAELVSVKTESQINGISSQERGFGKTINKSYSDLMQKVSASVINSL